MPPSNDLPRYRQLADVLRDRIEAGVWPPGHLLPTEKALGVESGLSRAMVREALALLRQDGLIETHTRKGSIVRPRVPVRRVAMNRYRTDAAQIHGDRTQTPFTADRSMTWSDYTMDKAYAEVPADDDLAELFGVPAGTMLLQRQFVFRSHGVPQQMSTSCYPLDMVAGTPLTDPDREPWPGGNLAQLHSIGIDVTAVEESVRARRPTDAEVKALGMPPGVPVLTITRRMLAGDRVVEVARDIVIPADRVVLDYRIDLQ